MTKQAASKHAASRRMVIASATAVVVASGLLAGNAMAEPSVHKAKHRGAHAAAPYAPYTSNAPTYDGPVYNPEGQVIGVYRGPVLGYSTSCNILTPAGYLYTCQNFTW
jgi:hypothetical protein